MITGPIQRIENDAMEKNRGTSFEHLLVSAITHVEKEKGDMLMEQWHNGGWNYVFQVEGIDVPLKAIMDEWEKQLERMLSEKAAEIVNERTANVLDSVETMVRDVRTAVYRKVEKALGVKLEREDR